MVDTDQSVSILTNAFTWFFLRTVPTSRKAKPACMAKTMTAPSMRKRTSPACSSDCTWVSIEGDLLVRDRGVIAAGYPLLYKGRAELKNVCFQLVELSDGG